MVVEIGISYNPHEDLFMSGLNQTAIVLGQLFVKLGYKVILVDIKNKVDNKDWWDNIKRIPEFKLQSLYKTSGLNLFIDIDGFILPSMRKRIALNSVVFLRTFLQFSELDNSVYPEQQYRPRDFTGVKEIWCWDILNPLETLDSIQTIFPCPIRRVPFIWSPWTATKFMGEKIAKLGHIEDSPWNIYICEKNTCNNSSCIIPLVAVRELVLKNVIKSGAKYKCYNADTLKDNKFFKENIYNNIQIGKEHLDFYSDDEGAFYKMLDVDKCILFSHSRFTTLRIGLLNAIWMGIPIIHNSPILRTLHSELNKMFYIGNNIKDICQRFKEFCNDDGAIQYYATNTLQEIRESILQFCSIDNKLEDWHKFINSIILNSNTINITSSSSIGIKIISFSDMWPGFNYNSNFIIDALRNELHTSDNRTELKGVRYQDLMKNEVPDLLIFGPYSDLWKSIPDSIPKVFFSGENWLHPVHSSIKLWMTSSRSESDNHIRIPTWMTFIDWWGNNKELPSGSACNDNPIRMPLEFAMRSHPIGFKDRKNFCGFVVSNPICKFRNDTFTIINEYKKVNSGGALYNNIGGQLSLKYPGGGCGDISKYNFFEQHKFTISFENSQTSGYITEKVLHSKMAGCVPLYWGDTDTDIDFVPGSIVNLSKISNPEQILDILKRLESQPDLCSKIAETPILNEDRKDKALNIISNMCHKLLKILNINTDTTTNTNKYNDIKYTEETNKLHKITNTYIINLDTRKDRWKSLIEAEPYLENNATRISAVNGKTLKMDNMIYKLFSKNQFKWKKSVMGCSLSHFSIWSKICSDTTTSPNDLFLILEDDVRFVKGWKDMLNSAINNIPEDAELLYLGGILPPNRPALIHCQEEVNKYWSRIKPNTFFSSVPLPIFHFCTYSYLITKQCVEKLLKYLTESEQKSYIPIDHLLGSPLIGINKYVISPIISYCFQEDDPAYINSNFNDPNKNDTFDSDICNNTECFTDEELADFSHDNIIINCYAESGDYGELYERKWLEDIFGGKHIICKTFNNFNIIPPNNSWFIVQRPHLEKFNNYFKLLANKNIGFKVLHLSDEFCNDDISFYTLPNCNYVIRNYLRVDIPSSDHILTIPLGYHHATRVQNIRFKDRKLLWSFHGTNWFGRKAILDDLNEIIPNSCHIIPDWNHPSMTREIDYIRILNNTRFVPILPGNNIETFRLYEALEAGCIPIYVGNNSEYGEIYSTWLKDNLGIIDSTNWVSAKKYMNLPEEKYEILENYRTRLLDNWNKWKERIRDIISKVI